MVWVSYDFFALVVEEHVDERLTAFLSFHRTAKRYCSVLYFRLGLFLRSKRVEHK